MNREEVCVCVFVYLRVYVREIVRAVQAYARPYWWFLRLHITYMFLLHYLLLVLQSSHNATANCIKLRMCELPMVCVHCAFKYVDDSFSNMYMTKHPVSVLFTIYFDSYFNSFHHMYVYMCDYKRQPYSINTTLNNTKNIQFDCKIWFYQINCG